MGILDTPAYSRAQADAKYSRVNDRGNSIAAALAVKLGDMTVGLAGDSTGDATDEWFYKMLQSIGADDPALKIVYNAWNDVPQTYASSTIKAGTSRYVIMKEDVFNRVSADLYGSLATTGATSWFGNSGGAGDWSVDGTAAVATADASNAEVTLVVGALTNSRTKANLEAVSAYAGSMTHDFIVRRASSTDSLRIRITYDNVGNTYQATLRQTIAGTVTTLISGAVTAMPGDRKFSITLDIVGLNITMTVNAVTTTATLSQTNADILNAGDQQGFQRFSNTTGDRITLFSSQRIDAPRTLTAYNGSRAGSTLDYQQARLSIQYPVPIDLLFISSSHNYGADSAATYKTKLNAFVQAVFALYPETGVVIGSQNPKFAPFSGDQRDNQRARCRAARAYALANRYGYLPVLETFDKETDGGLSKILADGLHPNTDGSTLWAGVAKAYLDSLRTSGDAIPVPGPIPGSHILTLYTSDSFTGGNAANLTGRTTDVALGGTGKAWVATDDTIAIVSGALARGTNTATGQVSIAGNQNDVQVSVKVAAIGTNTHYVFCRRADTSGSANRYQFRLAGSTVCLSKRVSNAYADIGTAKTIVAGDTVSVRAVGTLVQLRINNVLVDEVTDTDVTTGAYCGVLVGASGSTFGLDDFTINNVTVAA